MFNIRFSSLICILDLQMSPSTLNSYTCYISPGHTPLNLVSRDSLPTSRGSSVCCFDNHSNLVSKTCHSFLQCLYKPTCNHTSLLASQFLYECASLFVWVDEVLKLKNLCLGVITFLTQVGVVRHVCRVSFFMQLMQTHVLMCYRGQRLWMKNLGM